MSDSWIPDPWRPVINEFGLSAARILYEELLSRRKTEIRYAAVSPLTYQDGAPWTQTLTCEVHCDPRECVSMRVSINLCQECLATDLLVDQVGPVALAFATSDEFESPDEQWESWRNLIGSWASGSIALRLGYRGERLVAWDYGWQYGPDEPWTAERYSIRSPKWRKADRIVNVPSRAGRGWVD